MEAPYNVDMKSGNVLSRRRFVGTLLGAGCAWILSGGMGIARADPSGEAMLDFEERKRLRRELRQAHRERMRQMREAHHTAHMSGSPDRAGRSLDHPMNIESAGVRNDRHDGRSQPRDAGPHGMPFSDEEREQLRRQLRAQRAQRRETDASVPREAGVPPRPSAWRD